MKNPADIYKENEDSFNENDPDVFIGLIAKVQKETYLQALKDAEMGFIFMSDMSTKTQGFHNLQRRIKDLENEEHT